MDDALFYYGLGVGVALTILAYKYLGSRIPKYLGGSGPSDSNPNIKEH